MRDQERINRIASKFERLWKLTYDWRFCQLTINIASNSSLSRDPFYLEDEDFEAALDRFIKVAEQEKKEDALYKS